MTSDVIRAFVIACLLFIVHFPGECQEASNPGEVIPYFSTLVDRAYGLDQDLVNGVQYYDRYKSSLGHPYYLSDRFDWGSLSLRGKVYEDVRLKYDLYGQQVEIEYLTFSGGTNRLITPAGRVDEFSYGPYVFQNLALAGKKEKLYQVVMTANFTCFIYREKDLNPLANSMTHTEQFSETKSTYLLEMEGGFFGFNNRRNFIALFPEDAQELIGTYLKAKRFSFKNASAETIVSLMDVVSRMIMTKTYP